ncbi:MAG: ribonuclease HI family protein [Candidatus Helarchaeota archaeon]
MFVDGASRGNPGPSGIGIVIQDHAGNKLKEYSAFLGRNLTNNQAEYVAVLKALELAKTLGDKVILIYSDSELIVKQLKGIYRVQNELLGKMYKKIKDLEKFFAKIDYLHIRREKNQEADRLANQAIDQALFSE